MMSSKKAAIRYQKQKIEKEIAKRLGDGEDPNQVRKNIYAIVSGKYLEAREDIPASIKELRVGDMTLSGDPASNISPPPELLSGENQPRANPPNNDELAVPEYLPSVAAHMQIIPINLVYTSSRLNRNSEQVSTRLLKRSLPQKDSENASLILKSKGSLGLTYEEQSNLIERGSYGFFMGADALRARTPGQRGRSRKCRLAIFKSAHLSEFSWFSEEIMISLGDKDSTPACDESRSGSRALSPRLPRSTRVTRKQSSPPVVEFSNLSPTENGCTDTLKSSHIVHSSDHEENRSTGLDNSGQDCTSGVTPCNESHVVPLIEKDVPAVVEPGHVSHAPYEEKRSTLSGLSPDISPFTPINQSHSGAPKDGANTEAALHTGKEKAIPLKDVSKSQVSHMIDISAEEHGMSLSKSPTQDMPPAPIIIENSSRTCAQKDVHIVADGQTEIEPTTPPQVSPSLNALPPESDGTGTDAYGETMQIGNRLTKPVTISGGSVSIVRKNIIMDIMHMCDGVYSGHKELSGPFTTAWAKLNKPGTPDSQTIYKTFRSLVQSGKLRELKFSFQTPEGLMVTKSMITLTNISPTDNRVAEMQKLIIARHPSAYIPEGVGIAEEVRILPVYPSRFGTNAVADLEIDNEVQVRLQHKPLYITRLEERKIATEKSRQIREARLEAMRTRHGKHIQRAKFSVSSLINRWE